MGGRAVAEAMRGSLVAARAHRAGEGVPDHTLSAAEKRGGATGLPRIASGRAARRSRKPSPHASKSPTLSLSMKALLRPATSTSMRASEMPWMRKRRGHAPQRDC